MKTKRKVGNFSVNLTCQETSLEWDKTYPTKSVRCRSLLRYKLIDYLIQPLNTTEFKNFLLHLKVEYNAAK